METHPVTLIIGGICSIFLIALVAFGMTCTVYAIDPESYPSFKPFYEIAKSKRIC